MKYPVTVRHNGLDLLQPFTGPVLDEKDRAVYLLERRADLQTAAATTDDDALCGDIWREIDALGKAWCQIPAGGDVDVLAKLEIAMECGPDSIAPFEILQAIESDLRRLTGHGEAVLFNAEAWLIEWQKAGGSYQWEGGELELQFLWADGDMRLGKALLAELDAANGKDRLKSLVVSMQRQAGNVQ